MKNLDAIELHDAQIINMHVDHVAKTIVIGIEYYDNSDAKLRDQASILFEDVEFLSQIADFDRLESNRFAGTVNYWIPARTRAETTFIYLTDGVLAIRAKRLTFAAEESGHTCANTRTSGT